MFTKVLICLLLGSTLSSASPVDTDNKLVFRGWAENVSNWWNGAVDSIKGIFTPYVKQLLGEINELGHRVSDFTKEQYEEISNEYYEIRENANKAIEYQKQMTQKALNDARKISYEAYLQAQLVGKKAIQDILEQMKADIEEWQVNVKNIFGGAKKEKKEQKDKQEEKEVREPEQNQEEHQEQKLEQEEVQVPEQKQEQSHEQEEVQEPEQKLEESPEQKPEQEESRE